MYNVIHILHSVYRSVLLPASIGIRKNLQGNICGHVKIESCARHIEKAKACSPEGTSNMIVVILLVHWPIYPLVLSKLFSGGMLHLMLQIARIRLCPQAMPVSRVLINESHSCSHMKNNSDRAWVPVCSYANDTEKIFQAWRGFVSSQCVLFFFIFFFFSCTNWLGFSQFTNF